MKRVPFLELHPSYVELREELDDAYHRVMDSGWYLLGPETEAFEEEYSRYCGTDHCVSVANGMDALSLSLRAHDVGAGDEVIVPSHTFIATWLAISQVGGKPVPVEIDPTTYNLDAGKIEQAITPSTKAIVPVHLYGQMANMDPILETAIHYDLVVLEDAAQSQGAWHRKLRSGAVGDVAGHSFYPGKNLGAFSDGGAVTTDDDEVAEKIRKLRNYGSTTKYQHEIPGVNSRINELQAAFLRVKLRHLDQWNARRTEIANQYLNALKDVSELILPRVPEYSKPVWHLFVVRHPHRDELQKFLSDAGIGTLIHYPIASSLAGANRALGWTPGDFPIAEELANSVLSLPIGPHHCEDEIDAVCQAIRKFAAHH